MISEKGPVFNSKILLFGEYSLMKGSMALSIPFDKYNGQLLFDVTSKNSKSNHYSVTYLIDYLSFLVKTGFETLLKLNEFKNDIEHGVIFDTNIPISYGLGSSGAIVASIYHAYAISPTNNLVELKSIFSKMESYYHGKSSGLDPLVSYLDKAILISENQEIKTMEIPKTNNLSNRGIFLLDTKTIGETQPLVNWFINKYEKPKYQNAIQNQLIPLNSSTIANFLSGNFDSLIRDTKRISQFTLDNFKPMIPYSIKSIWKYGIESDNYYLKLCGSGGGGMMLGFTDNMDGISTEITEFELLELLRF
ncbi:MAG: mevalonate kinase [Bacteroidota bacterium]